MAHIVCFQLLLFSTICIPSDYFAIIFLVRAPSRPAGLYNSRLERVVGFICPGPSRSDEPPQEADFPREKPSRTSRCLAIALAVTPSLVRWPSRCLLARTGHRMLRAALSFYNATALPPVSTSWGLTGEDLGDGRITTDHYLVNRPVSSPLPEGRTSLPRSSASTKRQKAPRSPTAPRGAWIPIRRCSAWGDSVVVAAQTIHASQTGRVTSPPEPHAPRGF